MANPFSTPCGSTLDFSTHAELLHDLQADAERTCAALGSLMELLRGCDRAHTLRADGLESLLEPIWGGMDTLRGDLRTATSSFPTN